MKPLEKYSDDPILLKLHRRYGKDEALKYLFEEISSLRFQLGEMASENAELSDLLSKPSEPSEGKTAKEWKKDDYVNELKKTIEGINKKKTQAKKDAIMWRDRYFSLLAKSSQSDGLHASISEQDSQQVYHADNSQNG